MPAFTDRGFTFDVPDEWWNAGGMHDFKPSRLSYVAGDREKRFEGWGASPVLHLAIACIRAPRRKLSYGVFRDEQSVVGIFRGFRMSGTLPPILVVRLTGTSEDGCTHRLYDGSHRFYCSIAAGFTQIPAVEVPEPFGPDVTAPL